MKFSKLRLPSKLSKLNKLNLLLNISNKTSIPKKPKKINLTSTEDIHYSEYTLAQANIICDEYVLFQKFYTNKLYKRIIDKWSTNFFRELNDYIRGYMIPYSKRIKDLDNYKKILSSLIEDTSGLKENTKLFRGEKEVDLSRFVVGEENVFEGFIGTSFYRKVGMKFTNNKKYSFLIEINAKQGTKGIAINGKQLGKFKNQYEWLLNDGQRYITKKIDYTQKIIEINLI